MRPEDPDYGFLIDMREYAMRVVEITTGHQQEEFEPMSYLELALERLVEIVGEAAGRISPAFKAAHPEIRWRAIVGLRNVLAHGYADVNPMRLWRVATNDVPELIRLIDAILAAPEDTPPI